MRHLGRRALTLGLALAMVATIALPVGASTIPLPPDGQPKVTVTGTGATFPFPLYNEWFSQFAAYYNGAGDGGSAVTANVAFDYAAVGSGAGITAFNNNATDYGASDRVMTPTELGLTPNGGALSVPATLGADVLAYNLKLKTKAGKPATLKLTATLIGRIYNGLITRWNDPLIKAVNPGVVLPSTKITPVRRSDGSGTTFIFQSYLWTTSSIWRRILPSGPQQAFPTGPLAPLGGKSLPGVGVPRNAGVAARVRSTKGAIGYVELSYALTGGLHTAKIRNRAGVYVAASSSTTSAAAAAAIGAVPADLRILPPVNAAGKHSYPIVGYSFLLFYKDLGTHPGMTLTKAQMLIAYAYWAITTGQSYSSLLGYAPLPTSIRTKAIAQLHQVKFNGVTVWP